MVLIDPWNRADQTDNECDWAMQLLGFIDSTGGERCPLSKVAMSDSVV